MPVKNAPVAQTQTKMSINLLHIIRRLRETSTSGYAGRNTTDTRMTIHLPTMLRPELGATAAAAQGGDFTVLAVGSERAARPPRQASAGGGAAGRGAPAHGAHAAGGADAARRRAARHHLPGGGSAGAGQSQRPGAAAGGGAGRAGGAVADPGARRRAAAGLVAAAGTAGRQPRRGGGPAAAAGPARPGCAPAVLPGHPRSADRPRQPLAARGAPRSCHRPQPPQPRPGRAPVHRPRPVQVDQRPPRARDRRPDAGRRRRAAAALGAGLGYRRALGRRRVRGPPRGHRHRELAHAKGRELLRRLAEPCDALGPSGGLRASVGVALFPDDGEDAATAPAQADRRMYRAKGRRVLWSVFRRG